MTLTVISHPEILKTWGIHDPRSIVACVTAKTQTGCLDAVAKYLDQHENKIESAEFAHPRLHREERGQCWFASGVVTFRVRAVA